MNRENVEHELTEIILALSEDELADVAEFVELITEA